MNYPTIEFALPGWVNGLLTDKNRTFPTQQERMQLAIELSLLNVRKQTGGPFGAVVFEMSTWELVAPGVNLVIPSGCSLAHAEMLAIGIAQRVVGHYDLGGLGDGRAFELVTTTEPCAMCLGAIPWSGLSSVVCGARDQDARETGFEEGHKPEDWVGALTSQGLSVTRDVLRARAKAVLVEYVDNGGLLYNGGADGPH